MRSPLHRITYDEWHVAGLDSLLIDLTIPYLLELLSASSKQLAEFLKRGMRSTARSRISEFRNFAESVTNCFQSAATFRDEGRVRARTSTLSAAMDWYAAIKEPSARAYALLGITDVTFPE
jgi:hypothetical protein